MTSSVSLQASCHKYLSDKYKGKAEQEFASVVNSALQSQGIHLDAHDPKQRGNAFMAYFEVVDFQTIFVDTINKLLIDKWSTTNETWRLWVNNYGLTDFRVSEVVGLGVVKQPDAIPPGMEYKHSVLVGEKASAQLQTFGNMVAFDRDTVVNDDISAINSYIGGIANAYDRQIGDKVYSFLKDNPVTFNALPIFHTDNDNVVTATTSFEDDLGSAIELMTAQKVPIDDRPANDEPVHIQPRYVIVPASKAMQASKITGEYNRGVSEQQRLMVIVESRLTGFNGWFLACDNPYASIALFTLRDAMTPRLFTNKPFTRDGLEVKHRMDYDVKPVDYRGLVRVS